MHLFKGTFDVLILKTLSWGPAHGYAISRWIGQTSGDDLTIEEGALYPALRRLEAKGWLAAKWKTTETGREARVYSLTDDGRRALRRELAAWQTYVAAFTRVLETKPQEALT
jgi:PadR family transcriptional regulator PadR